MSISRIQAIETDNNVPKVDIDSTKNNIPKYPVDLEGGGGEPVLVSLNATENGEYRPEEGVDGFSSVLVDVDPHLTNLVATENGTYRPESPFEGYGAVVVNVDTSKPSEVALVDFDFKNSSLYDSLRKFTIPTQNYNNISTTNDGLLLSATNASCNLAFIPITNCFYEIKVKFGTNSDTSALNSYNALFKFNRTDNHQTLTYCRDVQIESNPMGTWRLNDESGNLQYLTVGYGDSHYFDNKELTIEYGYYYDNGVFTLNLNKFSYKINDTYIYIGTSNFIINPNGNPQFVLGGGATLKGTLIESIKIKQLFKWNLERSLFSKFESNDSEIEERKEK